MNTIRCSNCGQENKNTNIRCEFCGTELVHTESNDNFLNENYYQRDVKNIDEETVKKAKGIIGTIILIMWLSPFFLLGLVFICVSLYSIITDNNKSKNYLETKAILIDYDNVENEENSYEAIYQYTVNNVSYEASPNKISSRSGFEHIVTIKYNPNNPEEYVVKNTWNSLLIGGILIDTVTLAIFIFVRDFIKKNIYKNNSITNF